MGKRRKNRIRFITGVLLGISVLVIYMTHRNVPFMMDDLWYATILSDDSVPITSFRDIIRSQIWHYQNWGGRSITHGILQLTLLAGHVFLRRISCPLLGMDPVICREPSFSS